MARRRSWWLSEVEEPSEERARASETVRACWARKNLLWDWLWLGDRLWSTRLGREWKLVERDVCGGDSSSLSALPALGVRYTRGGVWTHRIHVNPHSVWIHSGYTVRYTASGFEDEHVFFAVSERGIRLRSPSPMPFNPNPDRARRGAGATALVPAPAPAPAPAATALAAAAPAAIVMA